MEIDERIKELELKIEDNKTELKELKTLQYRQQRPAKLKQMILKFEKRNPNRAKQNIEELVLKDETFDEWYNRIGYIYDTFEDRGKEFNWGNWKNWEKLREKAYKSWYERGGYNVSKHYLYIRHLIEAKDPRILNTKLYQNIKAGGEFTYSGLYLNDKHYTYWEILPGRREI